MTPTTTGSSREPDHAELVRELGLVRERGIVRVDSPNPDLRRLELPMLRAVVAQLDASDSSFVLKLLRIVQSAVEKIPDGKAKTAAKRLYGLDSDPTYPRPSQWRNEARHMYPLLGADEWRKGMEIEIIGLMAGSIIARLRSRSPDSTPNSGSQTLQIISDVRYAITSAFWAGRYTESATQSQTLLELAITHNDYETAAHFLANLILINRNRRRFAAVLYLMKTYFPRMPFRRLPKEYQLRLMKELFAYYYEIDDFERALIYLQRMERLDPGLMIYTPLDDWMPGIIRWRKAHLQWVIDSSSASLANAVAVAQEGVDYLQDIVKVNPNTAGLASAKLNVGWLYYVSGNPVCFDYFDEASTLAEVYSPRTRLEADVANSIAAIKFRLWTPVQSLQRIRTLRSESADGRYHQRSYAFLRRDPEWRTIRRLTDLLCTRIDGSTH